MYDIGFATREWQRDSILAALDGATYTHRWWGASWPGHERERYEEQRPLKVKMVRTKWMGVQVWMFRVTNLEATQAGRDIVRQTASRWFQAGDRATFTTTMFDGSPEGTPVTIVAVYAGDTYIRRDGDPQPLKEDGSPDLYRTKQIGPWWLDRASL